MDIKFASNTSTTNVEFNNVSSVMDLEYGTVYQVSEEYETYLLETPDGTQIPAVFVDNELIFDATKDDIRIGKMAATDSGVTIGEKEIPSYKTTEGYRIIQKGNEVSFGLSDVELYDYTKFQAIICPFNTSIKNSVAAEKVAINDNVYEVKTTTSLGMIIKDDSTKKLNFGIINDSDRPWIVRFITYKEI